MLTEYKRYHGPQVDIFNSVNIATLFTIACHAIHLCLLASRKMLKYIDYLFVKMNDNFRTGIFTVTISGFYLLSLTVCSQDKKKILISIRRNGDELSSLYDQNHADNNSNSMSSQIFIAQLGSGDKICVYLYTNTGTTDRKTNHFTQFSGLLLRPCP